MEKLHETKDDKQRSNDYIAHHHNFLFIIFFSLFTLVELLRELILSTTDHYHQMNPLRLFPYNGWLKSGLLALEHVAKVPASDCIVMQGTCVRAVGLYITLDGYILFTQRP